MLFTREFSNTNDSPVVADSESGNTDWSAFEFRRQWILAPEPVSRPSWPAYALEPLWLASHPDLPVTIKKFPSGWICLLGTAYDPEHPKADNAAVVSELGLATDSKVGLEPTLHRLAGRWALIVAAGESLRIYPDATASRSVFYASGSDLGWVASSVGLINEYLVSAPARELSKALDPRGSDPQYPRSNFWPGINTPYLGIKRLLPNHYLDWNSATASRFWPTTTLPRLTVASSAHRCCELLRGAFDAAVLRDQNIYVALTGGYDSRALLAASVHRRDAIHYFAIDHAARSEYDRTIPRKLASKYQLKYIEQPVPEGDRNFLKMIDHNTAGMVVEGAYNILGGYFELPADAIYFEGTCSEIGRALYYQRARHPRTVTAEYLCFISGFRNNAVAKAEFEAWLQTLPENCPVNVLDLFHWEIRIAGWCSMHYLGQDLAREICSPYNSHAVIGAMLAAPDWARQAPFRLHREICKTGLPGAERMPYNKGWRDRVRDWMAYGAVQLLPEAAVNKLRAK